MEQLTQEQSCVTAAQKSAEGIVGWPKIRQKLAEGTSDLLVMLMTVSLLWAVRLRVNV